MRGRRALWCMGVLAAAVAAVVAVGQPPSNPTPSQVQPRPDAAYVDEEAPPLTAAAGYGDRLTRGDALVRAATRRDAMAAPTVAGIGRSSWSWLGPGNFGGRVRSIVIDRSNPQTMYAGGVTGGVFKTTNGGRTWRPLDPFMANLGVTTLVSPAGAPRTLYAGTGEYLSARFRGAGVFKSVDAGAKWMQLPETTTSDWYYVSRLAVDPKTTATLLAATASGIWRTTNGGTNWTKTYATTDKTQAFDVVFDPVDGTRAIAGGTGWAAYSLDGGKPKSWMPAAGIPAGNRVELAYAPSNSRVVYASVDVSPVAPEKNGHIAVYKSTDGGHRYGLVYDKRSIEDQGIYDNTIWVDPTNSNVVVVGAVRVWRSTDGGATFNNIVGTAANLDPKFMHVDQHAIVSAPGYNGKTNRTVYVGNDGGVYKATDIRTASTAGPDGGWQPLNTRLGLTQFRSVAVNDTSGRMLGGTQDWSNLLYTGDPNTWTKVTFGDGGFTAADRTDPRFFYGETPYGHLLRSSDGGAHMEAIYGAASSGACTKAAPYQIPDACKGSGAVLFSAPFVFDPSNPNRLLLGGSSLWRTNDARTVNTNTSGPSWAQIKPPAAASGALITAIAVQNDNSNVVYVGHQRGLIYKSTNATADAPTWARIGDGTLPARDVLGITIDPTNANVVYATFRSYAADNVWRSTDGGNSWAPRSGSAPALPEVPVHTLVVNPLKPSWIYVGTEAGIFASEDAGQTWVAPSSGPANVDVEQLVWSKGKLIAATYGRGIYSASVR